MSAPPTGAAGALHSELSGLLARENPARGDRWVVAFSGGPDSTALAAALAPRAGERGLRLHLVHVDHGLDPGSAERARAAGEIAGRLGLPVTLLRREVAVERSQGESPEAAARRVRYAALEQECARLGATRILTAHQRDDQVETVLLRLLSGSGLEGLAGIPERRGALLRPLLRVPRAAIAAFLAEAGLEPVEDPTNRDLAIHRNFLRHALLPRLRAAEPGLEDAVLAVRHRAAALRLHLDSTFETRFPETSTAGGLDSGALLALPGELRAAALRWLLRRSGVPTPPSSPSLEAFLSSLRSSGRGVLALRGERSALVARAGRLALAAPQSRPAPFSYTFSVPGEVELAELGLLLRLRRSAVEPWMFRGERRRAALAGAAAAARAATVRLRRAGDRLRPFGSPGERKLKELLIDRRVPAGERDRLPVLEIGGRIAWVPGVTIGDEFRLGAESECWVAELEGPGAGGNDPSAAAVERVEKESR